MYREQEPPRLTPTGSAESEGCHHEGQDGERTRLSVDAGSISVPILLSAEFYGSINESELYLFFF
jgi:hypothetical protein